MTQEQARLGSIVLLAKGPGRTSFASLYQVKRALGTRKVGHTGTLDSFATGLLVVCVGRLTKAVPYITQADKEYMAVIEFGRESDTLDWTGKTVRSAPLPRADDVKDALQKYTGCIMQLPPQFSALHVAGKRASDIARSGEVAHVSPRQVTVYSASLLETLMEAGRVKAAMVSFAVSKGTYIRALARDIGNECGSAASLAALRRTRVGEARLEDAALYGTLQPFTIENALAVDRNGQRMGERVNEISEDAAYNEIIKKAAPMTQEAAAWCGFAGC